MSGRRGSQQQGGGAEPAESRIIRLKPLLDELYLDFDFRGRLAHDPLSVPHRYSEPEDIEVAGFIAASLAYGRVDLFLRVVDRLLEPMGSHPAAFLAEFDPEKQSHLYEGLYYRFSRSVDLVAFLHTMGSALREKGSLGALFFERLSDEHEDIGPALTAMIDYMRRVDTTSVYGENLRPRGLEHLLVSPSGGGAAKRGCLFLRWMIRSADIDLGLWKEAGPERLVIPLDTHIERIGRCLGLTGRKSPGWSMALEITRSLRLLDPEDPLRYDFALCHQGIAGLCRADGGGCGRCLLRGKN